MSKERGGRGQGSGGRGMVAAIGVEGVEFATTLPSSDSCSFEEEINACKSNHSRHQKNDDNGIHSNYRQRISSKSYKDWPPPVVISPSNVIELLECPVCTNSMYPPIYQCRNGHTICSSCKTRLQNRCPTCRQKLGDIRCLALEIVGQSLELPCQYSSLGCLGDFPYYYKLKHESKCRFRPYNCPFAGSECSVGGDIPYLVSHLRDDHKVDAHTASVFHNQYLQANPHEIVNATWMLRVFYCFGHYFCLHFEAFELGTTPVYIAFVRFMGDESESRNFKYSLEVGGSKRKLTWEAIPRSIRDSHQKVRDSHDGLIIQRKMALVFSGGDRKELKLRITGRIWREQHNLESGLCIT